MQPRVQLMNIVTPMIPLEPLFCPCCTPAILHTLAQTNLTQVPQQILLLGSGALSAVLKSSSTDLRAKAEGQG
jgi:hypothetical protein